MEKWLFIYLICGLPFSFAFAGYIVPWRTYFVVYCSIHNMFASNFLSIETELYCIYIAPLILENPSITQTLAPGGFLQVGTSDLGEEHVRRERAAEEALSFIVGEIWVHGG